MLLAAETALEEAESMQLPPETALEEAESMQLPPETARDDSPPATSVNRGASRAPSRAALVVERVRAVMLACSLLERSEQVSLVHCL